MNDSRSSSRPLRAAGFLAVAAASTLLIAVTACRPQPSAVVQPVASATTPSADPGNPTRASTSVSIDFPGGTLGDLAAHLPKAPAEPFNLIVNADHADISLPAFSIRDANSTLLAMALTDYLEPRGVRIRLMDRDTGPVRGTAVYVTVTEDAGGASGMMGRPFRVVGDVSPERATLLEGAIKAAWSAASPKEPLLGSIRYHAQTRQFFVAGAYSATGIFDHVLSSMPPEPAAQTE